MEASEQRSEVQGLGATEMVEEINHEAFYKSIEVNYLLCFRLAQENFALKEMIEQQLLKLS